MNDNKIIIEGVTHTLVPDTIKDYFECSKDCSLYYLCMELRSSNSLCADIFDTENSHFVIDNQDKEQQA